MHQLSGHVGICRHLDFWKAHVCSKNLLFSSLNTFASSNPTFDELKALANEMVHIYVATHQLQHTCWRKVNECDQQFKNSVLLNKYFLLYKEMSYAMNFGDIGHVETTIIGWILILKAIRKHKY
ncbi:hypothetical protein PAXRUDRAFT_77464, partial [Paxillus rubicundulus Ve08.2h10]